MEYETQENVPATSKARVDRRLEGYGHEDLKRVARKLRSHGVEVKDVTREEISRAIASMNQEEAEAAADDEEIVAALGELKLQEIEAEFGGDN